MVVSPNRGTPQNTISHNPFIIRNPQKGTPNFVDVFTCEPVGADDHQNLFLKQKFSASLEQVRSDLCKQHEWNRWSNDRLAKQVALLTLLLMPMGVDATVEVPHRNDAPTYLFWLMVSVTFFIRALSWIRGCGVVLLMQVSKNCWER